MNLLYNGPGPAPFAGWSWGRTRPNSSLRLLEGMLEGLTTGRIVHWLNEDGEHDAAIIIDVVAPERGLVGLQVFRRSGELLHRQGDLFDGSARTPGTWHFPERA